jgi:glycosyltransferase involved in cell wall biosynthesis
MFSIIIPLYNKAHIIERTLDSVLNQTISDYEIIVVDDGSTDKGADIITGNEKFKSVRLITQVNQGVSVARNIGIANASFNYVALLDGDDEWMPNFLEEMTKAVKQFPDAGFCGSSSWHRNIITGEQAEHTPEKYKGKIQVFDFFENPHQMPHTSAVVINKKIFNTIFPTGVGFPAGMKVMEDHACFYQIAFASTVVYVGFPLGIRNNCVEGQVTGLPKDERAKLIQYNTAFYNLIFSVWVKGARKPKNYLPFLKYDLRCLIISLLRINDFKTIEYFIEGLHQECSSNLTLLERKLYPNASVKVLSMLYIYSTKICWRIYYAK